MAYFDTIHWTPARLRAYRKELQKLRDQEEKLQRKADIAIRVAAATALQNLLRRPK